VGRIGKSIDELCEKVRFQTAFEGISSAGTSYTKR